MDVTTSPYLTLPLAAETWSTPALSAGRVVAADRAGRVHAWDAKGRRVWSHDAGAEITASPTLTSLDGTAAVLICDHAGTFVALRLDTGQCLWRRPLGSKVRATAAVAEIHGETAIVLPVYGPRLVRLDASGAIVYDRRLPKNAVYHRGRDCGAVSTPLVADVDGCGAPEAVFGVRAQRLYCCDAASGDLRWFRTLRYDPDSSPTLCADARGRPMLLVGGGEHTGGTGDNGLLALGPSNGRTLWRAGAGGGVDGAATVARTAGGDAVAVFTSLGSGSVIAIGTNGAERWRVPFGPTPACVHDPICRVPGQPYFTGRAVCRSYTTPLVADLYGGDRPVAVAGSNNGALLAVDLASGVVRARVETGGMVRGSPVLHDIDGDSRCELVVPSGNRVLVYRTSAPAEDSWPQTKGVPSHLGWRDRGPLAPAPGPPPRWVQTRLAWTATARDAARYAAFQLERRLLHPLGVRIADHYY